LVSNGVHAFAQALDRIVQEGDPAGGLMAFMCSLSPWLFDRAKPVMRYGLGWLMADPVLAAEVSG
jgi:hypothetical protein